MQDNQARQPRLSKKLTLSRETVRVLTDKELAGIEGGFKPTVACSGSTCACGGSCGNNLSTCPPS
jgi:bacteriocin-like protein